MREHINKLVEEASAGNKKSLELVIVEIKDLVYNLSLKMLLFHEDAKDASQEILIKIVTHLGSFHFQSQFKTWVYRVAVNHLLTHKGKKSKEFAMSFEAYENLIDSGLSEVISYARNEGEIALLEEEVKISCTQGLLLCLNDTDRMVYILTEILDFNSVEGSQIIGTSADNYRKKLSRSRSKIRSFLTKKCGIVNPNNPCRCKKKIDSLIEREMMDPRKIQYARPSNETFNLMEKIDDLGKSVAIYRSNPNYAAPQVLLDEVKQLINVE